jgi:predicted ATP-dependent endonuclease of OLD family
MKIKNIQIKNFRLLKDISISLDKTTTLIVGRNNTGKTSLTEIFRSFFGSKNSLNFEDFNIDSITKFKQSYELYKTKAEEAEVRSLLPVIEMKMIVNYKDNADAYGVLSNFILDLDPKQFETEILIQYKLADGKIDAFFSDIEEATDSLFYKSIKVNVSSYYEMKVYAVDPNDLNNQVVLEQSKLNQLMRVNFINAQRGLDDETHKPNDVLGKTLGNIFKSASLGNAPDEFKIKSEEINNVVKSLQEAIDSDFKESVNQLLPTLSTFGYPGLHDPQLTATTVLDAKSILHANTQVHYQKNNYITLPETYNGLGSRNLIYILFQLYDFFRNYQSDVNTSKLHLIFIEEPEAHLHPQMQEVFIRQISEIKAVFESVYNEGKCWPVQFVISTHSTHIANEAEFSTVRYFLSQKENETIIKDLSETFEMSANKEDKEFLHKYLTLTKCDLYFADIAILIEGATERILLPEIINKFDRTNSRELRNKYLSIVEIGGAYAHHFYKFLDFLELKTLVITDLDCSKKTIGERTTYPKSQYAEATHSTNKGLKHWFQIEHEGYADINEIMTKTDVEKVVGSRRIAYQVPEKGKTAVGRSFEDAFILANRSLFNIDTETNETMAEKKAFEKANDIGSDSKANFAIEYAINKTDWSTPEYLYEGLLWLSDETCTNADTRGGNDDDK